MNILRTPFVSKILRNSLLSLLLILSILCPISSRCVVINELMVSPDEGGEWIELYNESDAPVNLSVWRLMDASGNIAKFGGSRSELEPGKYMIIASKYETISGLHLDFGVSIGVTDGWVSLNDDGDQITLLDLASTKVDEITYPGTAANVKGRSWERISADHSGMQVDNWGPSADLNGHTAGQVNSVIEVSTDFNMSVRVDPNPFAPEKGESAAIFINIPTPVSRLSIDIYDLRGLVIKRLTSNIPAGSTTPVLSWNGRDNEDKLKPVGRYLVYAEAVDYRSGRVHKARCTVVLAGRLK